MTFPITPEERRALLDAFHVEEHSADLAERVNAEAENATALPWWFWEAAVVVVVLTIALSAAFPWGVAP